MVENKTNAVRKQSTESANAVRCFTVHDVGQHRNLEFSSPTRGSWSSFNPSLAILNLFVLNGETERDDTDETQGCRSKLLRMADVLSSSESLGLELHMEMPAVSSSSSGVEVQEADTDVNVAETAVTPPIEMLHEAALRSGINTVLDETAGEEDELARVREICQETLARMERVTAAKSLAHRQECNYDTAEILDDGNEVANSKVTATFSPPKSPQERLMAYAMEKGKARMGRRPNFDSYMKVDKSPLGHIADLNSTSGGTEVFLGYKKKVRVRNMFDYLGHDLIASLCAQVASVSDLHKLWLFASVTPPQILERGNQQNTCSLPPPSTPGKLKQLKSAFSLKATEVREQELPATPTAVLSDISTDASQLTGTKSSTSIVVVLVIRKCTKGFDPCVLHAVLKALTFIGDFDGSLAKSFEDELISKIMCAYEATLIQTEVAPAENIDSEHEQSSNALTRELVMDLIDDISTGAEIATITDNMLGIFKVRCSRSLCQ
ncbi:unnamed protein product [Phytophthora lilii]|uniref:Unnamed protein product n=1 Tax=Phytophthora lilii TaxID=2077276 RepID=A0A9W6WLQ7_9STRA|nr:unnamed protein product [Phytophthora lilii]